MASADSSRGRPRLDEVIPSSSSTMTIRGVRDGFKFVSESPIKHERSNTITHGKRDKMEPNGIAYSLSSISDDRGEETFQHVVARTS